MSDIGWRAMLPADPLPWLLESAEPAARWVALVELLDRPPGDRGGARGPRRRPGRRGHPRAPRPPARLGAAATDLGARRARLRAQPAPPARRHGGRRGRRRAHPAVARHDARARRRRRALRHLRHASRRWTSRAGAPSSATPTRSPTCSCASGAARTRAWGAPSLARQATSRTRPRVAPGRAARTTRPASAVPVAGPTSARSSPSRPCAPSRGWPRPSVRPGWSMSPASRCAPGGSGAARSRTSLVTASSSRR